MKNIKEYHKITIKIGDLFKKLNIDNDKYEQTQTILEKVYVENVYGDIVPILGYVKKRVRLVKYKLKSRIQDKIYYLTCSDKHLIIDEFGNTVKISESLTAQNIYDGILDIIDKEEMGEGVAYDIGIDEPHLYFTSNGIIHHNTTLTKILSKGYDTLTINCSEERGIDTIREKIIGFSSSISLMGGKEKIKVIVLEECDGMTSDAFDSLRAVIEKYADSVRFIGNCNNINKIPAPIQSRFNVIRVAPINQEEEKWLFDAYIQYVGLVLKQINCEYTDETIREFIKIHFPDMRSIINAIQSLYLQGAKELNKDALVKTFECSDLFEQIVNQTDAIENYKLVISEYANKVEETMEGISKNFVEFIKVNYPQFTQKIPLCVISIAEHLNMLPNCIDKTIVLLSCVYKLQIILHQ